MLAGSRSDPATVENALQEILNSQYFRSSAQCSSLLRYMVQNTLANRDKCLRERVIGTEVFDRAPDYDTGNDHIVRSRASEVRKRLAQYYQGSGATADVRISIPSGSYRAMFDAVQRPAMVATPPEPEQPRESVPAASEVRKEPEPARELPVQLIHRRWPTVSRRTFITVALVLVTCAGRPF